MSHRRKYGPEDGVNRINVDRETLWEDSIITFKSPKFDTRGTLRVRFAGEAGLDAGGLRMEYCSLLAKAIFSREASLFEGSNDRFVPIYNASAIQSDVFGTASPIAGSRRAVCPSLLGLIIPLIQILLGLQLFSVRMGRLLNAEANSFNA